MTDPIKTEPIPNVAVTLIADGVSPSLAGTIATTPGQQPNLIVNVVTPIVAILVRFLNTFCVSMVGTLTAGGLTSTVMPHADLAGLFHSSLIVASCIGGLGFLKDCATVFSGLEKKFPLASGSV